MEQLNGTITLAYLEEDNKQRIFFRVVPLCTREGALFADALSRYPDQGSLRVVPDKREQSTFKERMRGIGSLCAVCLSASEGKEISKVRQNKNYQPQQGEYNQFAIYSDVVCGFEPDALFEVLSVSERQSIGDSRPLTAQVLLLDHKVLYGPVDAAQAANADLQTLKPFGNDHFLLHTVKLPDGAQHTLYWNPEAVQTRRLKKSKPRPAKEEASATEPQTEAAQPVAGLPAKPPVQPPAPVVEEKPIAPKPAEKQPSAPAVEPKTAEPLPLGKPLQILDTSLSFDAHLERLSQPVSLDANRIGDAPAEREADEDGEVAQYAGTPLMRAASRAPVIVGRPKPLHYVVEKQIKATQQAGDGSLPADISVEQVLQILQNAWQDPESHEQLLRVLVENEGFRNEYLCAAARRSCKETRVLAAAQAQLADFEAERLSLLMQLERLRGDRRKQEQETLQSLSEQRKAQLTALESDIRKLEAQRASLEDATAALSQQAQDEIERYVRAHTWHGQPYESSVALLIPKVGRRQDAPELLDMLRTGLTRVGFSVSEDDVYQLLLHFALEDELCLCAEQEQDAKQFCKAFVRALGLDQVSALAPKDGEVRVVDALADNDCRTPVVLVTGLSERGQRLPGQKTLMYASLADYTSGALPACPGCPKVRVPSLSKALPENADSLVPPSAVSLSSFQTLQDAVKPLLSEQEDWFAALERYAKDAELGVSDCTLRGMRGFVSAASQKLRGGFIAAADAAVCHWIVPLMLRRSAADEIDPALKELPRALCMLGVQ